ncbi:fimbrial protein [Erwinia sp. PsM31]|uniref:fimbrial protein n=1 Tax=Erwinia sp. PsM31 TaxID=3030535 RepID=UPI00263A97A3|nr:fimbrial protein [Erwinia sp. PsM31]MDN4625486.1 fimbrial protein [Erwinia sp. PsM31]
MKKLLIAAALATAFTGVTAQADSVSTESSGTITFNGQLTSSTCKVNVNGSGNSDGNVDLPVLQTSALPKGATAGDTHFIMQLTDCTLADNKTTVSAFFQHGTTVNDKGHLINKSDATETSDVTLELLDANNNNYKSIFIGSDNQKESAIYKPVTTDGTATLEYAVRYNAQEITGAKAAPGMVSSSVVYALQYK